MINQEKIVSVTLQASALVANENKTFLTYKDYDMVILPGVGVKFTKKDRKPVRIQQETLVPSTIVTFTNIKSIIIRAEEGEEDGQQSKAPVAAKRAKKA